MTEQLGPFDHLDLATAKAQTKAQKKARKVAKRDQKRAAEAAKKLKKALVEDEHIRGIADRAISLHVELMHGGPRRSGR